MPSAQDVTQLGYVNTERILRDAAPAKAAQQKLEQEFSKRDKELQEMAARLKATSERLERDAAVTNETERVRRQREFADLEKDFQRKQREFREDLNQRRNEELAQVVERANRVIKQIAEQEKLRLRPAGSRVRQPARRHHREGAARAGQSPSRRRRVSRHDGTVPRCRDLPRRTRRALRRRTRR